MKLEVNTLANVATAALLCIALVTAAWKGSRWAAKFIETAAEHTKAMEKLGADLATLTSATAENTRGLTATTAITQQNTTAIDRVSTRVEALTTQVAVIDERVQHIERRPS